MKAIFLDRDGVINRTIYRDGVKASPRNISELHIHDGVSEAIRLFKSAQYIPIVVSNQPDVARNKMSISQLQEINYEISKRTGLEHFYMCAHDDIDNCDCRKPKTGLIKKAISDYNITTEGSFMIGDQNRDIDAGLKESLSCIYISENKLKDIKYLKVLTAPSLIVASQLILNGLHNE